MTFHIITIFPRIFDSYFDESIIKRAQDAGVVRMKTYDLRDWTTDKHRTVDDTPYGGGAGMVMKVEPLYKAVSGIKYQVSRENKDAIIKTVLLSAKGKKWNQSTAKEYAKSNYTDLILVCGRYEGVDERILNYIDEEISIGDYVLTGGELGAMVMIDSITRLLPGALGNETSAEEESHTEPGILEYPHYTRPEVFTDDQGREHKVPDILLSGNHAEIEKWRKNNRQQKTDSRRQ
jgi:tRNA (guanine37-N1)-methyltransferase